MGSTSEERQIAGVVAGLRTFEGEGFRVTRPFPTGGLDHLGPFLLLDEMGPSDNAPGEAKGAPDHPHRGFETVTYMLDGEIEHKDSIGGGGLIAPGDVQWMTAGSGIVHSEMPSAQVLRDGGRLHGFQLWVNLPKSAKWHRPRYQDLTASAFPEVDLDGGTARVIAGQAFGSSGPADTFLPINYYHLILGSERGMPLEFEPKHQAFVYVFAGEGVLGAGGEEVRAGEMALFDVGGGTVNLRAGPHGLQALVGSAEPLPEPVVRYGPFVMNTKAEIIQAFDDYRAGRMGEIEPESSRET